MFHPSFVLLAFALVDVSQGLRYLGRVDPSTKELTWSATGLTFQFSGKSATIEFAQLEGTNSAELIVDGKATYIPDVSGTSISTPDDLVEGNHTVEFRKSSGALFGSIFLGNVTTDGTFGPDVPRPKRSIHVIGDSITSAYGIGDTAPCTNTAALERISLGYGALTANALQAEYSLISWSGIGIFRNYPSTEVEKDPIMPVRYTRYGANDADGSYPFPAADRPDVVVINLGTNDFGHTNGRPILSREEYAAAVVKFVRFVEEKFGKGLAFFLLTSPMLSDEAPAGEMVKSTQRNALKDAVAMLNGTGAYMVDWADQGSDVGCDFHPSPNTNAIGAKALTEAIRKELEW